MSAASNRVAQPLAVGAARPAAVRLDQDSVYMTPTGRLCKLFRMDGRGGECPMAQLRYVSSSEARAADWLDGFNLRPENWRILTRVC